MKTRRTFLMEPGKFEIREIDIKPEKSQLLVKVAACGLCNWELNHWKGILGKCPMPLGHEVGGWVTETGEGVTGFSVGDPVTGLLDDLSGFSDYVLMSVGSTHKLNRDIDPKFALAEPLKCIVTVLRGAAPEVGDFGVILGCGPMGLWCIQALSGRMLGALIAIDIDDDKLRLAKKFGATHIINSDRENAEKEICDATGGHMADFVIEGTGIPRLLNEAMSYLRTGRGKLVLMSSHESVSSSFDFRPAINKSLELRVTHPMYSLDTGDDLRRAVSLINNGVFKLDKVVSHTFRLDEMDKAFLILEHKPAGYLKGAVIP